MAIAIGCFLGLAFVLAVRLTLWWQDHHPRPGSIEPLDPVLWLTRRYYEATHHWAGAGIPVARWPFLLFQLAQDCHAVLAPHDERLSQTTVLRALQEIGRGGRPSLAKEEDARAH